MRCWDSACSAEGGCFVLFRSRDVVVAHLFDGFLRSSNFLFGSFAGGPPPRGHLLGYIRAAPLCP